MPLFDHLCLFAEDKKVQPAASNQFTAFGRKSAGVLILFQTMYYGYFEIWFAYMAQWVFNIFQLSIV